MDRTMTRRELIGAGVVSMGTGMALGVAQRPQPPQQSDPVFDQILKEKGIVLEEIKKNNDRLTADTAKRLASLGRTLVVYGRSIRFDDQLRQHVAQAVTRHGRDSIIDARIDPAHMTHELAQHGLNVDVADLLRQLPIVERNQKEQTLNGILTGQITLLSIEATVADGLERMAATRQLAFIPQQPRLVRVQECRRMDCNYWSALAGTLSGIAGMICAATGPSQACLAAWAAVTSCWAGYWGCLAYNQLCGGGGGQR